MSELRPLVNVCGPGGGSHIATLAGADSALSQLVRHAGVSGVSASAILACARSRGVSTSKIQATLESLLQRNRVLDVNPWRLGDAGLCSWEVIPKALDALFGPGVTMGEALMPLVIVVTDLDSGTPRYLSSMHTPSVTMAHAARASSAIPGVAGTVAIPSLGSALSPDIRLHVDGGLTDNTADHVFDDSPHPRIALRLVGESNVNRVRHGDNVGQALSIFRAALFASSRLKSRRNDGLVIDLPANGNGFDFDLSVDEIRGRWRAGYDAVMARAQDIRAIKGAP